MASSDQKSTFDEASLHELCKKFNSAFDNQFGTNYNVVPDITYELSISLEELYKGTIKKLKITRIRNEKEDSKVIHIEIKPGYKAGTKLTFEGEGNQKYKHGSYGDVIVVLKEKSHDKFTRHLGSEHLVYYKSLTLKEALLGTKFILKTIDGQDIEVDWSNKVAGDLFEETIKGKGMIRRKAGQPDECGDLLIRASVRWPLFVDSVNRELISKLTI